MDNMDNKDAGNAEKNFTQADVDRIVAERLARERAKQPDLDAREKELNKRENALSAREKLISKKLPESLASLVAGAEDMDAAIDSIEAAMSAKDKRAWGLRHEGANDHDLGDELRGAFGLE